MCIHTHICEMYECVSSPSKEEEVSGKPEVDDAVL